MIEVYHNTHPTFLDQDDCSFPEGFALVAKVDTEHIGEAFRLTNSIDKPWTKNEEVEVVGSRLPTTYSKFRSTSVGDVVVKDGTPYLCRMMGWWVREDGEWKELTNG